LLIFAILISEWFLLQPIVNPASALYGMLFYLIRALAIFLVIILFLFISNRYRLKKQQTAKEELAHYTSQLRALQGDEKKLFLSIPL